MTTHLRSVLCQAVFGWKMPIVELALEAQQVRSMVDKLLCECWWELEGQ